MKLQEMYSVIWHPFWADGSQKFIFIKKIIFTTQLLFQHLLRTSCAPGMILGEGGRGGVEGAGHSPALEEPRWVEKQTPYQKNSVCAKIGCVL